MEVLYARESEINLFATAASYKDLILLFNNNFKLMSRLKTLQYLPLKRQEFSFYFNIPSMIKNSTV